ncbi:basic proline-rich protein-like [Vombatus ursinus]|uniref:basic proline-rich protein-like n=1 Tax=Vombatus ursinus TaxID=29139 RepID=UPI000FFD1EC8|nr:basic proline-rich protein-like [Vombatus ursinus]
MTSPPPPTPSSPTPSLLQPPAQPQTPHSRAIPANILSVSLCLSNVLTRFPGSGSERRGGKSKTQGSCASGGVQRGRQRLDEGKAPGGRPHRAASNGPAALLRGEQSSQLPLRECKAAPPGPSAPQAPGLRAPASARLIRGVGLGWAGCAEEEEEGAAEPARAEQSRQSRGHPPPFFSLPIWAAAASAPAARPGGWGTKREGTARPAPGSAKKPGPAPSSAAPQRPLRAPSTPPAARFPPPPPPGPPPVFGPSPPRAPPTSGSSPFLDPPPKSSVLPLPRPPALGSPFPKGPPFLPSPFPAPQPPPPLPPGSLASSLPCPSAFRPPLAPRGPPVLSSSLLLGPSLLGPPLPDPPPGPLFLPKTLGSRAPLLPDPSVSPRREPPVPTPPQDPALFPFKDSLRQVHQAPSSGHPISPLRDPSVRSQDTPSLPLRTPRAFAGHPHIPFKDPHPSLAQTPPRSLLGPPVLSRHPISASKNTLSSGTPCRHPPPNVPWQPPAPQALQSPLPPQSASPPFPPHSPGPGPLGAPASSSSSSSSSSSGPPARPAAAGRLMCTSWSHRRPSPARGGCLLCRKGSSGRGPCPPLQPPSPCRLHPPPPPPDPPRRLRTGGRAGALEGGGPARGVAGKQDPAPRSRWGVCPSLGGTPLPHTQHTFLGRGGGRGARSQKSLVGFLRVLAKCCASRKLRLLGGSKAEGVFQFLSQTLH